VRSRFVADDIVCSGDGHISGAEAAPWQFLLIGALYLKLGRDTAGFFKLPRPWRWGKFSGVGLIIPAPFALLLDALGAWKFIAPMMCLSNAVFSVALLFFCSRLSKRKLSEESKR